MIKKFNMCLYVIFYSLVSCFTIPNTNKNSTMVLNKKLKEQLAEIMSLDQDLRSLFDNNLNHEKRSFLLTKYNLTEEEFREKQWKIVEYQDSINLKKIRSIVIQYGYPGKTLVGEPENLAAWYVMDHSKNVGEFTSVIQKAVEMGEIPPLYYLIIRDREFMQKEKEQIGGTQIYGYFYLENNEKQFRQVLWPVKNIDESNIIRKKHGLNTIQEFCKENNVTYDFTISDYKKIKKQNKL